MFQILISLHFSVKLGVTWMKHLLQTHSSQLMALGKNEIFEQFGASIGLIEHRINNLPALSRARGRLDLLVKQIDGKNSEEDTGLDSSKLLVYEDQDSTVEENGSSSENEQWQDSDDEEDNVGDKNNDDDEMDVSDED